jgi:hypothetical protein
MRLRKLIVAAAALGWASAAVAQTDPCNMDLNITDQDPAGANVRASPGGAILKAVKAKDLWVQVHVTGAAPGPSGGAWARIDKATLIGDETDSPDKVLFKGVGWVAFSELGVEEFDTRTRIRTASSDKASVLLSLQGYDDEHMPVADALLGCDGYWLKVRVKGVVGWTDVYCANRLTTCG